MNVKIGSKLKELRVESGLTQQALADKLGISRVNYTRYETNVSYPDYDTLVALADFFDVPLDYIFSRHNYL